MSDYWAPRVADRTEYGEGDIGSPTGICSGQKSATVTVRPAETDRFDAGESRVLILGLGNVLLGDDGLGVAAVVRLARTYSIPSGVRVEDGGTLGMSLLGLLAEADRVILVDAVRADSVPGTLVRIDGDEVMDAVRDRLSPHQVGVADVLDAARLIDRYPSAVTLLGLVPEAFDLSIVRSGAVEAGLDTLVTAIAHEVESLGYAMHPQTGGEGDAS